MYTYIYMGNYIHLCYKGAFKNLKMIATVLVVDIDLVQKT